MLLRRVRAESKKWEPAIVLKDSDLELEYLKWNTRENRRADFKRRI